MESTPTWIVAFVTAIGGLLGGVHGALVAFTIASGIAIVLAFIGARYIAKAQAQAQADLVAQMQEGGAEWTGPQAVPEPDPQSGIVPATELPDFPTPEDDGQGGTPA